MTSALRRNVLSAIIGLLLLCIVGTWIELRLHPLQRFYDELILDNRNHYLSCQQLPTKYEVERILEEHNETIKRVEQVAPGFVNVEIDDSTCSGKADLLISYGTHQQRIAIENIVQNDTFFGIPYRLQNR